MTCTPCQNQNMSYSSYSDSYYSDQEIIDMRRSMFYCMQYADPNHQLSPLERLLTQTNIVGSVVFLTSYFITEKLSSAILITGAHGLGHFYLAPKFAKC